MNNKSTGKIILLMGISGSGKTTLGKEIKKYLENVTQRQVEFIDGDQTRLFIGGDIGYSEPERFLITKIIVYAAKLLSKNGINVIVSNIAGKKNVRDYMKTKWGKHIRIFLNPDINDCISNDPKGIYQIALQKEKPNLMGLDIPYDAPESTDLVLNTYKESVEESMLKVVRLLHDRKVEKGN